MEAVDGSDYIFKVIAIGEASVGKTSLTLRYATDSFQDDYRMTLGLNLTNKNVLLEHAGEELQVQLSIWDTGGQISFAPLLPMYYKGALGALIVYDLTKRKTFEHLDRWVGDVREHCTEIPIVIIGNKKDLVEEVEVTTEEGLAFSDNLRDTWENDIFFFETSAKEDLRVDDSFTTLAKTILNLVEEQDEVEEPYFASLE